MHNGRERWRAECASAICARRFSAQNALRSLTLGLALACSSSVIALAQTTSQSTATASASLRVRLVERDSIAVRDAEVSVKNGKFERVSRSDGTGMARAEGLTPGSVEIRVRRIGIRQVMLLARVDAGENEVVVHLNGSTAVLDEMRVVGNRIVSGRHEDFEMRLKRRDASAVITREQIDKRNPIGLSTMLRGIPGLRVADSLGHKRAISQRGTNSPGRKSECIMRMMVDGIVMPENTNLDQIMPNEVYGIEVFNGAARIPVELGGLRTDNWCGVIAIWTR